MGEELQAVRAAVAFACDRPVESLHAATRLDEIGADSLARVVVADLVEQRLGAATAGWQLPDATLGRVATLGELADEIAAVRSARPVTTAAAGS